MWKFARDWISETKHSFVSWALDRGLSCVAAGVEELCVEMEIPRVANDFHCTTSYYETKENIQPGLVTVIHGLSGSGKTQICAHLLLECKKDQGHRGFFINARTADSLNKDIDKIVKALKLNMKSYIERINSLPQLLKSLNPPIGGESKTVMVLDGVESDEILGEILDNLDDANLQQHLKNIAIIVNSRIKPRYGFHENQKFCIIHVQEFSKQEAIEYLKIPASVLKNSTNISFLPASLNQLKEYLRHSLLKTDSEKISKFLAEIEERPSNYKALKLIKESLEKLSGKLLWNLKHLSVFSRNDVKITDQLIDALDIDDPDSIVDAVVRHCYGDIQTQENSGIARKCMTLHPLVTKAVTHMVQNEEEPIIFRNSLLAFSRIMPRNARHHQNDIIPNSLHHAISLQNYFENIRKSHLVDGLTKLLFAELHTSIGYCMTAQRYDINEVLKKLEEGRRLFIELLFQGNYCSEDLEIHINRRLANLESFMPTYRVNSCTSEAYINNLQLMQTLSQEEFEAFFNGTKKLKYFRECDHLSHRGLEKLKKRNYVLDVEMLARIHPLELFAQLLHLLSKSYSKTRDHMKAIEICEQADAIYRSIKEHCGVALLGMYINRRFLYTVRAELEDLKGKETLREDWGRLKKESSGAVYENGIAKSIDISKDAYHVLICYEGEMMVCGSIASDPRVDPSAKAIHVAKGELLVKLILNHCSNHSSPFITRKELSRACIEISKFYQLCADYQKAISYSLKSMMEYHNYCLGKQSSKQGYPELVDDNKYYTQLVSSFNSLKEHRDAQKGLIWLNNGEKEYLEELWRAWKERCTSTGKDEDDTLEAIYQILKLVNQENPGGLPNLD